MHIAMIVGTLLAMISFSMPYILKLIISYSSLSSVQHFETAYVSIHVVLLVR